MGHFGHVRINVWLVCWFCFMAGILAGTLVGNRENVKRAGPEGTAYAEAAKKHGEWAELERMVLESTTWRKQPGDKEKFAYLCGRRLKEGGLGWLFGLTVCAAFCFCLLAGYMGFTLGWIITVYTVEWGIMGLPSFFLSCFPQMLLYLPAWGLLLWQGLEGRAKIRPLLAVTAALLLCGGAGLEAFINPWFI